ncbi:MAG TPA: hypothetical protein VG796_04720 [Verrucomicrobiales bacterium]|jgi:hypothetical protein|nr:hypothetical protein [Verrucomicrobiales bacterium]
MSSDQIKFLRLVEAEARKRGNFTNWVPVAIKVRRFVPGELSAEEAAAIFIRWLFREPADGRTSGAAFIAGLS